MNRDERLAELRIRCAQVNGLGLKARIVLDARDYAHWSDVRFLLLELARVEALVESADTQPYAAVPSRVSTSEDTHSMPTPATVLAALPPAPPVIPLPTEARPGDFDIGWNACCADAEARVSNAFTNGIRDRLPIIDLRTRVLIALRQMRMNPHQ